MTEAVAEVGSTASNYQILARLATGGMAEIFLARGVSAAGVERYCVLKRILRNRASDVSFVRMFLDEARLAAQLQHPNVAQVYDIGKLGDSYFFTMEYVHGETVRAIMQRARSLRRDLPLAAVLTIATGAAAGLHHAHERIGVDGRPLDIVHRDVSPSNLMVSYEGNVKVVDFGVAKAADRAHETRSGTVKGKISYLSPEQARGTPAIDRRSDLFSLGIVLWEMLTTERLYKRGSDFENMTAIVTEPPPAPSTRKSWIPPELDAITLRLLAKDPAERFQTADDLIEALEGVAGRSGTMISTSSLSRFLRDMFGQRPEPWVELDTAEVPEGVTVTSEPIPGAEQLAIPVDADFDLQLANVPKLDVERPVPQVMDDHAVSLPTPTTAMLGAGRTAPEDLPTTPHPKVADTLMNTLNDSAPPPPRNPPSPSTPPYAATGAPVGAHGGTSGPQTTIAGTGVSGAKLTTGAQQRIPATPHGYPSGPREQVTIPYPRATPAVVSDARESSHLRWQLFSVVAIAAIVGSFAMWFVMRGRGDDGTATSRAASPAGDAAEVALAADAQVAVESMPDAALVATAPGDTPDQANPTAGTTAPTADPTQPTVDPTRPPADTTDSTNKVDTTTDKTDKTTKVDTTKSTQTDKTDKTDKADKTTKSDKTAKTDKTDATTRSDKTARTDKTDATTKGDRTDKIDTTTKSDRTDKTDKTDTDKRPKKSDIELAWDDGRYRDVVAHCTKLPAGGDEARCVLAACKSGQESKARALLAKVPDKAKKRQYLNACKNAGVDLEPRSDKADKPAVDPCEADPMSCQH